MSTMLIALWLGVQAPPAAQAQPPATPASSGDEYVIGPRDVISIIVFNEPELSRDALTVDAEGTVDCPLIGRVKVSDLTTRQVEDLLVRRYSPTFLRNPSISVIVKQFRNMTVWVTGAVRTPRQVELQGDANLMAALTEAGNMTNEAGSYVLIIAAEDGERATGPTLPDGLKRQEQLRVSREDIERGRAATIRLRAGDTVFVPKAATFIISGQVRSPGSYVITDGLNVLQALALAGGATDRAAQNRIEVQRLVNGRIVKSRVRLTDPVLPNDTILVPARRM